MKKRNYTHKYGITFSMSRRGALYDNAMVENFFSILKAECTFIDTNQPSLLKQKIIDRYIYFYNHERIQSKTGVAPLTLRYSY